MADCKTCKENPKSVPYAVYELNEAHHEKQKKRLWIVLVMTILMLFFSNAIWIYSWMQYDYVEDYSTVEIQSDGGHANYANDGGRIVNGEN